ncbi:MAG: hypothetical protein IBX36_04805 [Dehalococcoidia bacterium]|nr:hypothetical protein [Dehalococcoidia bacterium]
MEVLPPADKEEAINQKVGRFLEQNWPFNRRRFWELVELCLAEARLPIRTSGKRWSKRLRWV